MTTAQEEPLEVCRACHMVRGFPLDEGEAEPAEARKAVVAMAFLNGAAEATSRRPHMELCAMHRELLRSFMTRLGDRDAEDGKEPEQAPCSFCKGEYPERQVVILSPDRRAGVCGDCVVEFVKAFLVRDSRRVEFVGKVPPGRGDEMPSP